MGKNISQECERGFACGSQGHLADKEKKEKEAYQAGRNLGYHLGYNLGFESGYEKGYIEGSTLGYNNGFLSALRLGEDGDTSISDKVSEARVCRLLGKLINGGLARILLTGCASGEAQVLLGLLNIEATTVNKGARI